jgi:L-alanine-DL-glutamate epimerase-like enolase superfamily enzyme
MKKIKTVTHCKTERARALQLLHHLEPYTPFWFEEPVQPENFAAMAWIASRTNTPIATGERLFTRHDFLDLLNHQAARAYLYRNTKRTLMSTLGALVHNPCT